MKKQFTVYDRDEHAVGIVGLSFFEVNYPDQLEWIEALEVLESQELSYTDVLITRVWDIDFEAASKEIKERSGRE